MKRYYRIFTCRYFSDVKTAVKTSTVPGTTTRQDLDNWIQNSGSVSLILLIYQLLYFLSST